MIGPAAAPGASHLPADEMLERVVCNLCGAGDYEVVYPSVPPRGLEEIALTERFAASSGVVAAEQVVRCRRCDLVYMNPRLNRRLILDGYTKADNSTYVSQGEGRLRTFRRCVRLLEPYAGSGERRLLDVGCAGGFFLKAAQDKGWAVHGVEPSQFLVDYGRRELGLTRIVQGTLMEVRFPENHFDAVTYWDVLEHTADPARELVEVHRIMRPGGILLVNYPDFSSIWARLLGRKWWFLLSVHLYYFTPETIGRMLEKTGFELLQSRMHFQNLSFGYLIRRLQPYSLVVARVLDRVARALGMEQWQVRYYASQTNVLARKTERG